MIRPCLGESLRLMSPAQTRSTRGEVDSRRQGVLSSSPCRPNIIESRDLGTRSTTLMGRRRPLGCSSAAAAPTNALAFATESRPRASAHLSVPGTSPALTRDAAIQAMAMTRSSPLHLAAASSACEISFQAGLGGDLLPLSLYI